MSRAIILGIAGLLFAGCSSSNGPIPAPAASLNAEHVLNQALAQAKAEDKRVLVYLSAPWCKWCHVLEDMFQQNAALFQPDYLIVKIDVDEMEHGQEVQAKLYGSQRSDIPWMAILDSDGHELINCDGPRGNIGCPFTAEERAYFMQMIDTTAQHSSPEQRSQIAAGVQAFAEKWQAAQVP